MISTLAECLQECAPRVALLTDREGGLLWEAEFKDLAWHKVTEPAPLSDLLRVHGYQCGRCPAKPAHQSSYIEGLRRRCEEIPAGEVRSFDPAGHPDDTNISQMTFHVASLSAAAAMRAVDVVLDDANTSKSFVPIRPPGHHAGVYGLLRPEVITSSQGFCLLNNVAIAAAYAMAVRRDRVKRVAIVDFDVHAGDGTADIVRAVRPRTTSFLSPWGGQITSTECRPWLGDADADNILFLSMHVEAPNFYPGASGRSQPTDSDNIVCIGLPASTTRRTYMETWHREVPARLLRHAPDVIFVSAGFDAALGDEKGNHGSVELLPGDYAALTRSLLDVCAATGAKLVSVLEGGYNLKGKAPLDRKTRRQKPGAKEKEHGEQIP